MPAASNPSPSAVGGRRRAGTRGVPRADRERQILAVAGQVFAERGYHAAAMDDIAARCDLSKPMLYAYFGSKEGLYLAYIDGAGQELLERVGSAAAAERDPAAQVRAGIDEFLRFVEEHRDGWAVLHAEAAASEAAVASRVVELRSRIAREIGRLIGAAVGGRGDEPPLEGLGHACVGAGESLAQWWLANPGVERGAVAGWLERFVNAGLAAALERR